MNLQTPPSKGSCLITSLAILLDIPVQELRDEIGHSVLHISEAIFLAEKYGYALLYFDFILLTEDGSLRNLLYDYSDDTGILLYDTHAVAYDRGEICNPGAPQNKEPTGFAKLIPLCKPVWFLDYYSQIDRTYETLEKLLDGREEMPIRSKSASRIEFMNGYIARKIALL